MTAPVASGYPDFGRYQAQATKIYADSSQAGAVNPITIDLGYVGDVAQLGTRILNTGGTFVMDMAFHDDGTYTNEIGDHSFSFRTGDSMARTVPVLGPFCRVTIIPVTTPVTVEWKFYQAANAWASFDNDTTANVLASAEASAAAPGVTAIECSSIWPGEAILFARLPGVLSAVSVYGVSSAGSLTFLTSIQGTGIEGERRVILPAQHIRLHLANTSGVNQNFTYSLTANLFGV